MPLKIKRLAREPERFIWAVSMAQSRCINMRMTLGALVQDANMFVPYAGEFLLPLQCCLCVHQMMSQIIVEEKMHSNGSLQIVKLLQHFEYAKPSSAWSLALSFTHLS